MASSPRPPPLTALRAFDAAARHMSFAGAADELAVTPAALSFQIRRLESHFGLPLFRRMKRALALTEAGRTLAPGVADGFASFRRAAGAVGRQRRGRRLTLAAGPDFVGRFLAPRICRFVERHPAIEIRIAASPTPPDFAADGVDAAIRLALRPAPGLYSELLLRDRMTPVCAPALAARLTRPADLAQAPLIHHDGQTRPGRGGEWGDWLEAAGVERPGWRGGARFSSFDQAIAAATEGGAVALGRVTMAAPELVQGRLAAPFDLAVDPGAHPHFLCPAGAEALPPLAAFLGWLRAEIAAMPPLLPDLRVLAPRASAGRAAPA